MSSSEAAITAFPVQLDESAFINRHARLWMPKRLKRMITFLLVIVLLTSSGIFGFYAYMLYRLQKPAIATLVSNPLQAVGLPYRDVSFHSRNGETQMQGWYIPSNSRHTVILSHGYGANREEPWVPMYQIVKELNKNQYNVLMFDYSFVQPNRYVTGGIQESEELIGAIQFVKELGDEQIYIWGFSMGAGTALQTAIKDSQDIAGMILDSTFILDSDTMYYNLKQRLEKLPRTPSIFMLNLLSPIFTGHSLKEIPTKEIRETDYPMPLFMVHGERDKVAPSWSVKSFYDVQKNVSDVELWLLPKGQHELIYRYHKEEYMERTMNFLNNCVQLANTQRQLAGT